MVFSIRKALATICLLSILLALASFPSSPGMQASAGVLEESSATYTIHMKKATSLSTDSICDSLFYREAVATPGDSGLTQVTIWVADPIPNYTAAGQSLSSVSLVYNNVTYPATLDTAHKVTKSFAADPMFFPAAGNYAATPITFSIPQEAIESSASGTLKCIAYVNAVLNSQQEFYMVLTAPGQEQNQQQTDNGNGGTSAATPADSTSTSKTKTTKKTPKKKATKKKSASKKSTSKKKKAAKTVTYTYTYSYTASFRKATDFNTKSICDPLFSTTAKVVVCNGLAKITLYVIDPIPNYSSEGTPLSDVSFSYGGKAYSATYDSAHQVKKAFAANTMFITNAGTYSATPITVTLPAAAIKASANKGLTCNAFIRAVLKTNQSFYVKLGAKKLLSTSKTVKKLAASKEGKTSGASSSGSYSNTASASKETDAAAVKSSAKSTAAAASPASEVAGELPCKTGTAHGSYTHPKTQEVADSAGPVGQTIGQAMVDKVVDPTCLLQTGSSSWLTLRFNMAKSISNIRFSAQEPQGQSWDDAAFSVTGTGEDTEDLRVQVASQDTILKCVFHVGPIDRDVTFFIYGDQWTDGNSTNFATMTYSDEAAALGEDITSPATVGDANASSQVNFMLIGKIAGTAIIILAVLAGVLIHRRNKRKKSQA